jgi:sugar phosphate isomerase/epimerase
MDKFYLSTIDENAHLLAQQHGFGLEIAEFCTPWFLDTEFQKIDPIVREKLRCSSRYVLHAPFSELFPCAIDPLVRAVAAQRYQQTIQIAQAYGISRIVVHGGYNPRIYFPVWYTEQSISFWKEFVAEIPKGMVLYLENVFEEEPSMLCSIIEGVNDPRLRMCLDVGHVNAYSHIPVLDWLRRCAGIVGHFHIHNNDTSRDSHSQLSDGTIPMEELLSAIDELCPTATLTMELTDSQPSVQWLLKNR